VNILIQHIVGCPKIPVLPSTTGRSLRVALLPSSAEFFRMRNTYSDPISSQGFLFDEYNRKLVIGSMNIVPCSPDFAAPVFGHRRIMDDSNSRALLIVLYVPFTFIDLNTSCVEWMCTTLYSAACCCQNWKNRCGGSGNPKSCQERNG
jgi:hypothetical protein